MKNKGSWELIQFSSKGDTRGELVAIESQKEIPFSIKRVYYLINTKKDVRRGFHAHKNLDQILIAISGSCKILVENHKKREEFFLNDCKVGLRITNLVWREMYDFTPDCALLVLASQHYDPDDYIRDYQKFAEMIAHDSK